MPTAESAPMVPPGGGVLVHLGASHDASKGNFHSRWTQLQLKPEEGVQSLGKIIPMETAPVTYDDYERRYHKVMIPLSLFAPHVGEEKQIQERIAKAAPPEQHEIPLHDHLKIPPTTIDRFLQIMALRVHPIKEVQHTSVADQQELIRILSCEIQNKWLKALGMPPVPSFSLSQNNEVLRRMALGTILICENIFKSYLDKADILNKRGIFSSASNMTRLRTQLGIDVNEIVDVNSLKRHVVDQIKEELRDDTSPERGFVSTSKSSTLRKTTTDVDSGVKSADADLIKMTRASKRIPGLSFESKDVTIPLKRLQEKTLDSEPIKKLMAPYLQQFKDRGLIASKKSSARSHATMSPTKSVKLDLTSSSLSVNVVEAASPSTTVRRPASEAKKEVINDTSEQDSARSDTSSPPPRCQSMPELRVEEDTLAAELGMDSDEEFDTGRRTVDAYMKVSDAESDDEGIGSMKGRTSGLSGSSTGRSQDDRQHQRHLADDLARLTASGPAGVKDNVPEEDDDGTAGELPPLLQAILRHSKHDGKRVKLQIQLEELEARERARQPSQQPLAAPTHPQPAVVAMHVPRQNMVVKASDVRVSNRACLASMTIRLNTPIFNDLIGEVDNEDIASLDQKLFMKNDISEVYQELMKTVPKDHQELGRDQLLTEPAPYVPLNQVLSSTNLRTTATSGRTKRLVNTALRKNVRPPWEQQGRVEEWIKTAAPSAEAKAVIVEARRQSRQVPSIVAHEYRDEPQDDAVLGGKGLRVPGSAGGHHELERTESLDVLKKDVPDASAAQKASRAYNSWLAWWKNTLNTDDYMKFLATQETDFLSHVFHLYDSDVEDEDEEEEETTERGSDRQSMISAGTSRAKTNKPKPGGKVDPLRALREEDPALIAKEEMRQVQDYFQECESQLNKVKVQKNTFQPGVWNCGAVLLGGLGKDPGLKDLENLGLVGEAPKPKTEVAATLKEEFRTKLARNNTDAINGKVTDGNRASAQERLERVWSMLKLPDRMKLDMAVKYSSEEYVDKLMPSLRAWESASKLIVERENLMAKLESLESMGSDPNRFYQGGYMGSSKARFKEAAKRDGIHHQMDLLQRKIEDRQKYLWDNFQDVLTYEGRAYLEKMQWDETEMLFYLQEERRKNALNSSQARKELTTDGFIGSIEVVKNQQARMMSSKMGVIGDGDAPGGVDLRSLYIPTAHSISSRTTMRTVGTVVPQM